MLECLPSIYEARVQSPALKKRKNRKKGRKKMTEFQSSGSRVVRPSHPAAPVQEAAGIPWLPCEAHSSSPSDILWNEPHGW